MKFIDHTGHLFELKSYNIEPIGYEYEETKYVFWFDNEQGYKMSVNTYAIKPIRLVFDKPIENILITINSKIFSLISSTVVAQKLEQAQSYNIIFEPDSETKEYESGVLTDKLDESQLIVIDGLKAYNDVVDTDYTLVPFYVACKSKEAGTWESNVLVHTIYKDGDEEWCPFTVASEIVDECEELIINGRNMGVYLPKEILKAVYQSNYNNDVPDERLYAQKLKEYLMNFMDIKGQIGNYKSALNALKWFGWGEKLEIYKLLRTDNEFQAQYIRDNFDIANDTIYEYRFFKNEALLAISLRLDEVSEDTEGYDFAKSFWGEDKPTVSDLMDKMVVKHYDEGDLDFYKPYFDYEFTELGLKLCMLKYYYEKYFLPLHLSINSMSMSRQTFANDIKFLSNCSPKITADPVFLMDSRINVEFPYVHKLFMTAQYHVLDENFIEFDFENSMFDPKWKMYETCICVPIVFTSIMQEQYFDVVLKLIKDCKYIYSRNFQFNLSDLMVNEEGKHYLNFVIHPKSFNRYLVGNSENNGISNDKFSLNLWLDSTYKIEVVANNNNYNYDFTLRLPDFGLRMAKLCYQYNDSFRQLCYDNKLRFLSFMWNPDFVTVNNIDYVDDLYFFQETLDEYVNEHYNTKPNITDHKKYLNKCHLYKLLENDAEVEYDGIDFDTDLTLSLGSVEDEQYIVGSIETDLENETNKSLYSNFFKTNDTEEYYIQYVDAISNVIESEKVKYDFYLMHDKEKWYVVLISKDTIEDFSDYDLKAPKLPNIGDYKFEYELSDEKFLVNRFLLDETGGNNKFKQDDIIAFYLESNYKLPYKVGLSSKWLIKPMSIGMNNDCEIDSPSEIAIVSMGDYNFKYEKGYYSVVCRYSLDDFYQESVEKKGIFMIE